MPTRHSGFCVRWPARRDVSHGGSTASSSDTGWRHPCRSDAAIAHRSQLYSITKAAKLAWTLRIASDMIPHPPARGWAPALRADNALHMDRVLSRVVSRSGGHPAHDEVAMPKKRPLATETDPLLGG